MYRILQITSFVTVSAWSWGLRRSTAVEIPTAGAGASRKLWHKSFVADLLQVHSSLEELLCLGVEGRALLDGAEALDLQRGACLLDGSDPGAGLGACAALLAHNLAVLVLGQVLRRQATDGLCLGATEHHDLGHPALADLAHGLLLHCLHGLHPLHCLPRLRHCLKECLNQELHLCGFCTS